MSPVLLKFGPAPSTPRRHPWAKAGALLCLAAACSLTMACASPRQRTILTPTPPAPGGATTGAPGFQAATGIEVVRLRLSAGGHLLDLRYRVTDAGKAAAVLAHQAKPMLVDPSTGAKLSVPTLAYVGALRQTSLAPEAGKTYFILFANPAMAIPAGKKLDLVLGNKTLPGLTVE